MTQLYYKRNLPHYQPDNAIYFITFRLAFSLPKSVILSLKEEYDHFIKSTKLIKNISERNNLLYKKRKQYFGKFDKLLDGSNSGVLWLKNNDVAKIVYDSIMFRDKKEYDLHCFCIMPNHVHMVFEIGDENVGRIADSTPRNGVSGYRVTKILQDMKKYAAKESNKILNRSGQFWHNESYDHVIRNSIEFGNIVNYVIQNPVKAGLVDNYKKWKWTYVANSVKDLILN